MLAKLFSLINKKDQKPMKKIDNHFLYLYSTCPFCFRVRVAMTQLGIDMEIRNIHQGNEHLNALRAGGGSTMVPCLRIEENGETQWMYESGDIVAYLKGKFGAQSS